VEVQLCDTATDPAGSEIFRSMKPERRSHLRFGAEVVATAAPNSGH